MTDLAPPAPLPFRNVLVAFSGLLLAMLLAALDSTIVATALPTIVGELGGLQHLSWVVTAYLLAQTVVTPLYGKLGDLYGRRGVLQTAIVIFLVGSALCGLSRSMTQLIVFRALQGIGGGGLMVTTVAAVGDIIPPRERGRYQGMFGAMFGLASIAGPLLGGWFTTRLSWRWIFDINLPLGVVAIVVLAATLPAQPTRSRHAIDWAGAALLALLLSAVVLLTDLGGTALPWRSGPALALTALAVLALVGFVLAERRAPEPVLPLRLFANRIFTVSAVLGLIVGFALFGAVTYVPVFLQVVKGADPTASGLLMLPMMAGMLATSIASGQHISRTGRYRAFPIAGTVVMTAGLALLAGVHETTRQASLLGIVLLLGLGLGMVMQVLVLAAQNAVDYRDLGVATSGATLLRLVGGSVGTAALGALMAARLSLALAGSGLTVTGNFGPQTLARLEPAARATYAHAFTLALDQVFLVAAVVSGLGVVPLRAAVAASAASVGDEMGEAFAMPADSDPVPPAVRAASALADRDVQRRHIAEVVARAGLDLLPVSAWLLVRIEHGPERDPAALGRAYHVPPERIRGGVEQLTAQGLLQPAAHDHGAPWRLTAAGCAVLGRLVDARRARLAEVFEAAGPERHDEVAAALRALVPDAPGVPAAS